MSEEMCIDIIPIPTTQGKTHLFSQRLSLNMPRLNQNQQIQALTMLARGDNVSIISRAFGCHRNTIIRLRQRFQQTDGVVDRRRPGRPKITNPLTLTHIRRQVLQDSTVSANRQCCASLASPATKSAKEAPCGKSAYSTSSSCPFAVGTKAFPLGATAVGSGPFSDESRFNLSHHDGRIRVLEEEGNVLLIIVSLTGTDLEVGVSWYGVALWAEGKQFSLLCKATSMLKVTLARFCNLKLFLSFKGMGLQY